MRGAGHNFGISIEADVQTAPQESKGLLCIVDLTFVDENLEDVLKLMNEQILTMPPQLAVEVVFAVSVKTLKVCSLLSFHVYSW